MEVEQALLGALMGLHLFTAEQRQLQAMATEKLREYAKQHGRKQTRINETPMREAQALITEAVAIDRRRTFGEPA